MAHADERLRAVELAPFAVAARAGIEALMTAHVLYPSWDAKVPATLSRRIAHDILRGELGFAGVDHFLVREPRDRQVLAFEALVRAGEARADVRARIEESAGRALRFKARLRVPMPASADALTRLLGTNDNQTLAESFIRVAAPPMANSPVVDA